MNKQEFSERLSALRINKGVSARDMSLSIGQSPGYINNIENGINYPSMQVFFYICDFLGITPKEFFDTDTVNPTKVSEDCYARTFRFSPLPWHMAIFPSL